MKNTIKNKPIISKEVEDILRAARVRNMHKFFRKYIYKPLMR